MKAIYASLALRCSTDTPQAELAQNTTKFNCDSQIVNFNDPKLSIFDPLLSKHQADSS